MKFNRGLILWTMVLAMAACMAGCMSNPSGTADPTQSPDFMPQGAQSNAPTPFDWRQNAQRIEAQIAEISEIGQCRVAVTGSTALVGVKFDEAYEGQLTERIREMVAGAVMAADPTIQTVAVTADDEDVKKVEELADRMRTNADADTLKEEINEIVRNATTLR